MQKCASTTRKDNRKYCMCVGEIMSRGRRGKEAPRQQEQQEDLSLAGTHTDSRGPL